MLWVMIFLVILGLICIYLGYLIWKKEKITLIHDYHYAHVAEWHKKPYCELMGKGVIAIGAGILVWGVVNFITAGFNWGWIAFAAGFIYGCVLMIKAGSKYNRP